MNTSIGLVNNVEMVANYNGAITPRIKRKFTHTPSLELRPAKPSHSRNGSANGVHKSMRSSLFVTTGVDRYRCDNSVWYSRDA